MKYFVIFKAYSSYWDEDTDPGWSSDLVNIYDNKEEAINRYNDLIINKRYYKDVYFAEQIIIGLS